MLEKLHVQPISRALLDAYIAQPKHAVLLTGESGVGLKTIARALAAEVVSHPTDIREVVPEEKQAITIEQIRALYVATRDRRMSRQVVLIDNADLLSFDAQNAYLKLLEEPNDNVYFILTTHAPEMLLPTITSRTQRVEIRTVSGKESAELLEKLGVRDAVKQQQMLFLAAGLPAELTRLAVDEAYFAEQTAVVKAARELLQADLHARLALVARYTDRMQALRLVAVLGSLVAFMLTRSPEESRLLTAAQLIEQTAERLGANGHVRTQLANLVCQMS